MTQRLVPPFEPLRGRPALSGRLLPEPGPPCASHGVVFYWEKTGLFGGERQAASGQFLCQCLSEIAQQALHFRKARTERHEIAVEIK